MSEQKMEQKYTDEEIEQATEQICVGGKEAGIEFFRRHSHLGFAIAVDLLCELNRLRAATSPEAAGTNYVANKESGPTEVRFSNGRRVWIAYDSENKPYLEVSMMEPGEKWLRDTADTEDGAFVGVGMTPYNSAILAIVQAKSPEAAGQPTRVSPDVLPFNELYERSKDDRAFIAGSEIREVIGRYRTLLAGITGKTPETAGRGEGWIDVKQELPNEAGVYLVFWRYPHENLDEGHCNFAEFDEYGGESGELCWEDESTCDLYTHWRPLPAPPSGEQVESKCLCAPGRLPGFWITEGCPLHGPAVSEAGQGAPVEGDKNDGKS